MENDNLVIQKNFLSLLETGMQMGHSPAAYWPRLFAADEMRNLLNGYPYQPSTLLAIINQGKIRSKPIAYEILLYLSHLVLYFRSSTGFTTREIGARIPPRLITKNYASFHLLDDRKILELLCLRYVEGKTKNGPADEKKRNEFLKAESLAKLKQVESGLRKVFAPLSLSERSFGFDERLKQAFFSYSKGTKIFILPKRQLSLDEQNYYFARYASDGKTYTFAWDTTDSLLVRTNAFIYRDDALIYHNVDGENHLIPWHFF
jgi:hypothetical protein